jgi:hypothetical protein
METEKNPSYDTQAFLSQEMGLQYNSHYTIWRRYMTQKSVTYHDKLKYGFCTNLLAVGVSWDSERLR